MWQRQVHGAGFGGAGGSKVLLLVELEIDCWSGLEGELRLVGDVVSDRLEERGHMEGRPANFSTIQWFRRMFTLGCGNVVKTCQKRG